MGSWAQLIEQMKKIWSKFAIWQKISISSVLALTMVGAVALIFFSHQSTYEPLYTGLDPSDASAITAKLKDQKIEYKLSDDGATILVPSEQKYQLRLDLANEVALKGVVGFESFNQTRFGETDTDKRVRFLVALQGELTRTIEELDEVNSAKVHIALPAPSLFIRDEKDTTASVLLRLKPYAQLKPEQVKSIISFVSHSVEGLKAENVTVMDVNGNLLSESFINETGLAHMQISVTQLALKNNYEQEYARSIQTMLERVWGAGRVVVRANVILDFDQVETQSETFGDSVLASEQKKEETSKGSSLPVGGNPADANMGTSYGSINSSSNQEYESSESMRNYEISKSIEKKNRCTRYY